MSGRQRISQGASSPGSSGGGAGKGRRACNYVSRIYNEYLHQKSRCGLLIGGDDISNDFITLGTCFSIFFTFALIGGNLTAQSTRSQRGNGGGFQIPET